MKQKRIAIYARVSTEDQTNENQIADLQKWAENCGHEIVATYTDKMSGMKSARPGFQKMMKAATRREFDMVAVWALDRLGRSLHQVSAAINQLVELDVHLFAHKQGIDSTTSVGRSMLGMCAVFAELERDFIVERTKAGLARARRNGVKLGRPRAKYKPNRTDQKIKEMLINGSTYRDIMARLSVGASRVKRVVDTLTPVTDEL